jgi:WD40 repeat protein
METLIETVAWLSVSSQCGQGDDEGATYHSIKSIVYSDQCVVTGGKEGMVVIWHSNHANRNQNQNRNRNDDDASYKCRSILVGHRESVESVAVIPANDTSMGEAIVVSGSVDGALFAWRQDGGQCIATANIRVREFESHRKKKKNQFFSAEHSDFLVMSSGGGSSQRNGSRHGYSSYDRLHMVRCSKGRVAVVCGRQSDTVHLFQAETLRYIGALHSLGTDRIVVLGSARGGDVVVAVSDDGLMQMWSLAECGVRDSTSLDNAESVVAASSNSAERDDKLPTQTNLVANMRSAHALCASPDGSLIAVANAQHCVIVDAANPRHAAAVETADIKSRFGGGSDGGADSSSSSSRGNALASMAFADASTLLMCSTGGSIVRVDCANAVRRVADLTPVSGDTIVPLRDASSGALWSAFAASTASAGGAIFALANVTGQLSVLHACAADSTDERAGRFRVPSTLVEGDGDGEHWVASHVCSDSMSLALGSASGCIRVRSLPFDRHGGRAMRTRHDGAVRALLVQSGRVVSAGDDCTLRVADLQSGEQLAVLAEHSVPVLMLVAAAASLDERFFAIDADGNVGFYALDGDAPSLLFMYGGHAAPLHSARVRVDNASLIVHDAHDSAWQWCLDTGHLRRRVLNAASASHGTNLLPPSAGFTPPRNLHTLALSSGTIQLGANLTVNVLFLNIRRLVQMMHQAANGGTVDNDVVALLSYVLPWGCADASQAAMWRDDLRLLPPWPAVTPAMRGALDSAGMALSVSVGAADELGSLPYALSDQMSASRLIASMALADALLNAADAFKNACSHLVSFLCAMLPDAIGAHRFVRPALGYLVELWNDPVDEVRQAARSLFVASLESSRRVRDRTAASASASASSASIEWWLAQRTPRAALVLGIVGSESPVLLRSFAEQQPELIDRTAASLVDLLTTLGTGNVTPDSSRWRAHESQLKTVVKLLAKGYAELWQHHLNSAMLTRVIERLFSLIVPAAAALSPPATPIRPLSSSTPTLPSRRPPSPAAASSSAVGGGSGGAAGAQSTSSASALPHRVPRSQSTDALGERTLAFAAQHALLHIASVQPTPFMASLTAVASSRAFSAKQHAAALQIVTGIVKQSPESLADQLPAVVSALLRTLSPDRPRVRDSCRRSATALIGALVQHYVAVSFHSAAQQLAVCRHNVVVVYDLKSASEAFVLSGHSSTTSAVAFEPTQGKLVASFAAAESGGCIIVWQVPSTGFFSSLLGSGARTLASFPVTASLWAASTESGDFRLSWTSINSIALHRGLSLVCNLSVGQS